ncbi:DUF2125 domain-containing protein [Alterinioella nitratireducens]|uniref:DUF2125 domain-containing protein n=1 Tax=Alterinioella nitratireducens TaxID=2735915 RepID=UPI0040584EA9
MKLVAWIVGLAALLWSGVWLAGAITTERLSRGWFEQRQEAGWVATQDEIETTGFPLAFETAFRGVNLADPFTEWAWQAEQFHLVQPAWQPQSVRAIWPRTQLLATPLEQLTITSDRMEALLHVRPTADFALVQAEADLAALRIDSDLGWTSAVDSARFEMRDAGEARYDIQFDATGVSPAGGVLRRLDPRGLLPEVIERVHASGEVGFDRPWDITALEVSRPQFTRIDLEELRADWGALSLRMSGTLEIDGAGVPTGDVAVRAENWRQIIALGVNAGLVPPAMQGTLETGLSVIANLSGRAQDVDVTLSFADGRAYLGPIPLGPSPYFYLY